MDGFKLPPRKFETGASSASVVIIPLWATPTIDDIERGFQATAQQNEDTLEASSNPPTGPGLNACKAEEHSRSCASGVEAGDCRLAETGIRNGSGFSVKVLETERDIKVEFLQDQLQDDAMQPGAEGLLGPEPKRDFVGRRVTRSAAKAAGRRVPEVGENPPNRVPTKSRSHRAVCVTKTGRRRNRVLGETFETEIDIKVEVEPDQSLEETVAGLAVNDEEMLEPERKIEILERRVTRRTTRAEAAGSKASEVFHDPVITKPGRKRSLGERELASAEVTDDDDIFDKESPEAKRKAANTPKSKSMPNKMSHRADKNVTKGSQIDLKCSYCEFVTNTQSSLLKHYRQNHPGEKLFKCELCNYQTDISFVMLTHRRVHTGEKPYKCDRCDYAATQQSGIMSHRRTHSRGKTYKCLSCDFSAERPSFLAKHYRLNHPGEKIGPFKCELCDFVTSKPSHLENHRRKHTGEKPYKCELCDYAAAKKNNLVRHRRIHTGAKPYQCDICDYATGDPSSLSAHKRTHAGEKPYKCDLCNFEATHSKTLRLHRRTHTGEKPHKCTICDFSTSQFGNLVIHLRIHSGVKPYKCEDCDFSAARSSDLVVHRRTHTGEKPYKCHMCNYAGAQSSALRRHLLTHSGLKAYKCTKCDFAAPGSAELRSHHLVTHTPEKLPYKCEVCEYATAEACKLVVHRRIHTGDKPYKCDLCDYATCHSSNLLKHRRTHTGEKPYKCAVCDFAGNSTSDLKKHNRIHTGEKPYKCEMCDYATSDSGSLAKHSRTHSKDKRRK